MPKPQGTYLRIQQNERSSHNAEQSRQSVATSRSHDLDEFFKALDRYSERELDRWYGSMGALVDKLKNGKPLSKEDESLELMSKAVGEVRKVVENVRDKRQLEGRLSVPLQPILNAPKNLGMADSYLGLAIALCQVLEVLARLRKRK